MVIELFTPQGGALVCQAIAQVHVRDRTVGRSLLEGLVRELLEYHLHRHLGDTTPERLQENLRRLAYRVETDLRKDLQHRGVTLGTLDLRPVRVDPAAGSARPGTYRWVEFLSPEIGTRDGFQVVCDTVALVKAALEDYKIEPMYANRCCRAALSDALMTAAGGLDLEDLLGRRAVWNAEALERGQEILRSAQLHLEYLAVTDIVVRPRKAAFRAFGAPSSQGRDLLEDLFFMPYGEAIREDEEVDRP